MSEIKQDNEKIRGFAGLIASGLLPLNENTRFKQLFADKIIKILLNAINLSFAALIIIDHGHLKVESISNQPKENLEKKKIGWNAKLEMDSQTYLALAMNRLSMLQLSLKIITGKVKIRGIRKLLILKKILLLLSEKQ